jgi:hypothetical protein
MAMGEKHVHRFVACILFGMVIERRCSCGITPLDLLDRAVVKRG